MKNPMRRNPSAALLAMGLFAGMAGGGMPSIESYLPKEKPSKKCLLPGCDKQTYHSGGFCCAEHCKADKAGKKGEG